MHYTIRISGILIPATFPQVRTTLMNVKASLAHDARDVRLDLFLGIANWFLFLDHTPNNVVSWITIRNFGFSGAADALIFISGYTASITYGSIMLERGTLVGATRVFKRAWQLYAAYIVLFAIYIVMIGDVAARYAAPDIFYEFNIAGLIDQPIRIIGHGVFLQSKALNLDALQLYVVLMACFPAVLWMMLRKPGLTMAGSVALYFAARAFDWNLSSYPDGVWYFNPFCWQLLFVFGAWCALGGTKQRWSFLKSPILVNLGIAYLIFALVMTMAGRFPEFGTMFPSWLVDAFNPNDKVNLAPYRVLHLVVVVFLAARFLPKDWRGLQWPIFQPLIICGQQALSVFCVGVFLSFACRLALMTSSGTLTAQISVSVFGMAIMTLVARYISWSKRQDHPPAGRAFPKATVKVADRTLLAGDPG
jgi:hypothetical protein